MDFSSAIQAHTDWKLRLLSYCRGTLREKPDCGTLQKDNVCALGQWLHGDSRAHSSDPLLNDLVGTHAAFHRCAATVAKMVENGQRADAEAALNSRSSEFGKLSLQVVGCLMKLRDRRPASRQTAT